MPLGVAMAAQEFVGGAGKDSVGGGAQGRTLRTSGPRNPGKEAPGPGLPRGRSAVPARPEADPATPP